METPGSVKFLKSGGTPPTDSEIMTHNTKIIAASCGPHWGGSKILADILSW